MLVLPVTGPDDERCRARGRGQLGPGAERVRRPAQRGALAELRDEISEAATEAGGSAALVAGPFGVELRRLLPVTTPER